MSLYKWRWSKQRVFLHAYSEGIKYERERIIKLLEAARSMHDFDLDEDLYNCGWVTGLTVAMKVLTEGENK